MVRLVLSMMACFCGGSLLESVLHYAGTGAKGGGKWVYLAAAGAFVCLAAALVLLQRPWRLENIIRRLVGTMGVFYAGFILSAWTESRAGAGEISTRHMLISMVSIQGAALVLVGRLLREHRTSWGEAFGLRANPGRALLVGALAAALFMPVGLELQRASASALERLPGLGVKPEVQPAVKGIQQAVSWPARAALGAMTILLVPLGEELLFRGIFYAWLKQAGFPRLALWCSALGFAAIHANLAVFVPLLVLALVLTAIYEWTGNLLAPIAAHTTFNALGFVLLSLAK